MKHALIYKGKNISHCHWAEFIYNDIYTIEFCLTYFGSTRIKVWVNHDPEKREIYLSSLADWCCGDDLEMVKRLTKVIIGIIDIGEIKNIVPHSDKKPVHLDQKFMHWIKVQERRIPTIEIPLLTKLIIKQKSNDTVLKMIRKQLIESK